MEFHVSKVFMPEKNILPLSLNLYLIFAIYVFASLLPSTFLVKMSQASLCSVTTSLHICSHREMLQRLHHQHPPPGAREKRKK